MRLRDFTSACVLLLSAMTIQASEAIDERFESRPENTTGDRNPTPHYWKCENRVGGFWKFGQAPEACDAASFGDDAIVFERFQQQVFSVANEPLLETQRYMTELHAVIRDAATYYIRRRNPRVSPVEVVMFRRAVLTIAHQESYWSHYRLETDKRLKLVRGDKGHGHGLMQIDDRFHFARIDKGDGWGLISNLLVSLELYYSAWENAPLASCVKKPDNLEARARASYSVYNGGEGSDCRWTDPKDPWAANDKGFYKKLHAEAWKIDVSDPEKPASFDVACALDGGMDCYKKPPALATDETAQGTSAGAFATGTWVRANEGMSFMRSFDDQSAMSGTIEVGTRMQILAFKGDDGQGSNRRYQVYVEGGGRGWIDVGSVEDQAELLSEIYPLKGGLIPSETLRVKRSGGIAIRDGFQGTQKGWLAANETARILDRRVEGEAGRVHFEVEAASGARGWIYGGRLRPQATIKDWVGEL